MDQAERECRAYCDWDLWERCHRAHLRFRHVFECPNSRRADRLFDDLLRAAVPGRRVLEVGCADGTRCQDALALGASHVLGVDVSEHFLADARTRAIAGQLEFALHDIARPLAGRFDVIFGSAILHHLDYRPVLARLYEDNLAPGGLMLFREPLGANLLIRLWWRFGGGAHSPDERPFYPADLAWLRARFPALRLYGVNYLSLPAGIVSSLVGRSPDNVVLRWCDGADHWIDSTGAGSSPASATRSWRSRNRRSRSARRPPAARAPAHDAGHRLRSAAGMDGVVPAPAGGGDPHGGGHVLPARPDHALADLARLVRGSLTRPPLGLRGFLAPLSPLRSPVLWSLSPLGRGQGEGRAPDVPICSVEARPSPRPSPYEGEGVRKGTGYLIAPAVRPDT